MADLLLTSLGDITITDGDFAICSTDAIEDSQVIMARIETNSPDWYCHPELGANFEDLRGQPSSQSVGNKGVDSIINTLTVDGYFSTNDLTATAIPEAGAINFFVVADDNTKEPVVLNYKLSS